MGDAGGHTMDDEVIPASFLRFTLSQSGGAFGVPPVMGPCQPGTLETYSIDASSRRFEWDYCDLSGTPSQNKRGQRALTEQEYRAVLKASTRVHVSRELSCGADGASISLRVETPSGTTTYMDDFASCFIPEHAPFVHGIDALAGLLPELASTPALPAAIDGISISFRVPGSHAPDSPCGPPVYKSYGLEVTTRKLSWNTRNVFCDLQGSRTLSLEEVATVHDAYGKLTLGASEPCGDWPLPESSEIAITLSAAGSEIHIKDEASLCLEHNRSGAVVIGTEILANAFSALAP
jgi:hypothetical protein